MSIMAQIAGIGHVPKFNTKGGLREVSDDNISKTPLIHKKRKANLYMSNTDTYI